MLDKVYAVVFYDRNDGDSIEGGKLYIKKEQALKVLESLNLEGYRKVNEEFYQHESGHKGLSIAEYELV